jgi:hypothetical protein
LRYVLLFISTTRLELVLVLVLGEGAVIINMLMG